jgi:hypothetical protein
MDPDAVRIVRAHRRHHSGSKFTMTLIHQGANCMKIILLPVLAAAALGIAGCSQNAQNETAEAGNAIAADTAATTDNAVGDVDAATDRSLDRAGAAMDNAGADAEAGADRAGQSIANGADRAADATGEALQSAGNAIRD